MELKKRKRNLSRFSFETFISITVYAATFVLVFPAQAADPVAVSDTGYEIIHFITKPSLYWLDNTRLLFAGINRAEMQVAKAEKDSTRGERLRKLYLWNEATKSVQLYADAKSFCMSQGTIHYPLQEYKVYGGVATGKYIVKEGPFGSEKEIEKPLPTKEELSTKGQMARVHSNFTCKVHLRTELIPPAPQDHSILVLREGDGYVDAGPRELSEEIRLHGPGHIKLFRPDTKAPIDLPISLEQGIGYPIYSEYIGAYVTLPKPKGSQIGY